MASERVRRQIDRLLDEAEAAMAVEDWETVGARCNAALALDPGHEDARTYLEAAGRAGSAPSPEPRPAHAAASPAAGAPTSFAAGRYRVERFLGEGGKKRVFQAHDTLLDRDVAFALIRAEGLDATGRQRITHEAQAMARLSNHPNIVSVFDLGLEGDAPYIVSEYMGGGSVAGLVRDAEGPLPLAQTLRVAIDICRGLEAAHATNVIHRDLKPGNIWLTEDGTAKIGDFGLALALDRSRLTQQGMMIGTAAYMPPEQALGAEVTPQSDIYSLGCILYETVTGRPPFSGDDPVAVISQHINVPPVAPSWHSNHCPPGLEAVILDCLAKDPAGRPSSAARVREALAEVDPNATGVTHSDSRANPLDRLARGVFVGREQELRRLRDALVEALAGRGSVVMLVGEPGIGKTRTAQELETFARMRGCQVLVGRTHEHAGVPAFWPWVEVGRAWGRANEDLGLPEEVRAELVPLFPELRERGAAEPEKTTDPESAQFRLLDAFTTFIKAASERVPLLIVLDDLHWADGSSLLLLRHMARSLAHMRVMVAGTYRDTDITRQSTLSETLASLNRESGFQRIVLRGLSRNEVGGYIQAVANVVPSSEVLDRVFEETEGNPFFLSEVVNLMTQEKTLAADSLSDIAIPDGVREALGRRLDRLSEEAVRLLQTAAVEGRDFHHRTLLALGEHAEEELLSLLEEGLRARVIEETENQERLRFTHALIQETLLDELPSMRRARLHGLIGEALERRWGGRADERAARLARHFVEGATLSDRHATRAMHYSKLAAEQAKAQTAWSEAARRYEDCLAILTETETVLDEDEAEILVALGVCHRNANALRDAWRALQRAIGIYRERGDRRALAIATLEAVEVVGMGERGRPMVEEALRFLGEDSPELEARLRCFLVTTATQLGVWDEEAATNRQRAAELAEECDLERVKAELLLTDAAAAAGAARTTSAVSAFLEAHRLLDALGHPARAHGAYVFAATYQPTTGDLAGARALAEGALSYGQAHHLAHRQDWIAGLYGLILLLQGKQQQVTQLLEEHRTAQVHFLFELRAEQALISGDFDEAVRAMPPPESLDPRARPQVHATRTRILLAVGERAAAVEEFTCLLRSMDQSANWTVDRIPGVLPLGPALVARLDEAFLEFAHGDAHRAWLRWFFDDQAHEPWEFDTRLSLRELSGRVALAQQQEQRAEEAFRGALEWAHRQQVPIVAGRCHQGLAETAAQRGDHTEAMEQLDAALGIFRRHAAKYYLDQVIARKLELQGAADPGATTSLHNLTTSITSERPSLASTTAPDGTVSILFSDIEGSTTLNVELGDDRWMEVLADHNRKVRECIAAHRGFEVKTEGDAFMVAFQSARDALRCAVAVQRAFVEPAEHAIRVRIGLHTGEPVRQGGDFYGTHVVMASRIAAQARGGEILVSALLRELVAASGEFTLDGGRELELKGLPGTHQVFAVK